MVFLLIRFNKRPHHSKNIDHIIDSLKRSIKPDTIILTKPVFHYKTININEDAIYQEIFNRDINDSSRIELYKHILTIPKDGNN